MRQFSLLIIHDYSSTAHDGGNATTSQVVSFDSEQLAEEAILQMAKENNRPNGVNLNILRLYKKEIS